jgi:hypothetical protein
MNNVERISFAIILLGVGVAAGMYYEHQRFLKEIQGLSKKHADAPPTPDTPTPQPTEAA